MELSQLFEPEKLPPEPQAGNIEYKLKLVCPSKQRFEHLVTQMKWRLREGGGEARYHLGVADCGLLTGLPQPELSASLRTLQQMASRLGATTSVVRQRVVSPHHIVAEVRVRREPPPGSDGEVRVAVLGCADAGKSTLLGVLAHGELDNGRGRARLHVFRHLHEVRTGRTSSVSHETLGFDSSGRLLLPAAGSPLEEEMSPAAAAAKLLSLIDLAGHRKYQRTTVAGLSAWGPHHALLVASAAAPLGPVALDHLALASALDLTLAVAITKTDLTSPTAAVTSVAQAITGSGGRKVPLVVRSPDDLPAAESGCAVPIFPVSSVTGEGLDLLTRYLHTLPPGLTSEEREALEAEPAEFQVDETFLVPGVGQVVGGLLARGVLSEGAQLLAGPDPDGSFHPVTVASLHRHRAACRSVRASQSACVALCDEPLLRAGMVLLAPPPDDVPPPRGSRFFQAAVRVLYHSTAIRPGFQTTVHLANVRQTAVVEGIMAAGGIRSQERASVLFRFARRPEYVRVGMRLLFREGRTRGVGEVTQVFPEP